MGSKNFRRKLDYREQSQRFLIVSEGAVTERQYLEAVKRLRRIRSESLEFMPPGPTSPVEIVKRARDLRYLAQKEKDPFDQVWCVFDVEAKLTQAARPRLLEAIEMARVLNVQIALSNPCFELWILLHYQPHEAWIDSGELQEMCSNLALVVKKNINAPEELLKCYETARIHAVRLEAKHAREFRTRLDEQNPSSSVYHLIDAIFNAFPLPT